MDKYERAPDVLNEDVVTFSPRRRFSLIVSISTLEHVGWDETPREPRKTLRALEHLTSLLEPGGELVVTFPLGYNPHLDRLLRDGEMVFRETCYLKRVSLSNTWREVDWSEVEDARYGYPYHGGNAVVVGVVRRPAAGGIAPAGAA